MKVINNRKILACLLLCFILFNGFYLIFCTSIKNDKPESSSKIFLSATSIEIKSDKDPLEDGSYIEGSKLTFTVDDDGYSEVILSLTGAERGWDLEMDLSQNSWAAEWDTSEPTSGEEPVPADTYELTLEIDGKEVDCDPNEIVEYRVLNIGKLTTVTTVY